MASINDINLSVRDTDRTPINEKMTFTFFETKNGWYSYCSAQNLKYFLHVIKQKVSLLMDPKELSPIAFAHGEAKQKLIKTKIDERLARMKLLWLH